MSLDFYFFWWWLGCVNLSMYTWNFGFLQQQQSGIKGGSMASFTTRRRHAVVIPAGMPLKKRGKVLPSSLMNAGAARKSKVFFCFWFSFSCFRHHCYGWLCSSLRIVTFSKHCRWKKNKRIIKKKKYKKSNIKVVWWSLILQQSLIFCNNLQLK